MKRNVNIETSDVEDPAANKMGSKCLHLIKKKIICYAAVWNGIFVTSCIFAVYLDPFFFYVVIIDQDKKCLEMDKTLRDVAFAVRSLTDLVFAVHLIYEIRRYVQNFNKNTLKNRSFASVGQTEGNSDEKLKDRKSTAVFIVIGFLALIPLPQLLIVFMSNIIKGSGFVENLPALTFFLLCQYLPRIHRIELSAREFKKTAGIWVKSLYNLILYILACHVLGAFWYFFSIQRELSCWQKACVNHSQNREECLNTFHCSLNSTARNIPFLNEHCPLDNPDGELKFGIFLDSLKKQNTEHIKFGKKFIYSFWWGLRNLSNFGTNLTTSTNVLENLFAVLISLAGLLLFIYLIGNVQTYMQMDATKEEEKRHKSEETEDMRLKMMKLDVKEWMYRNEVPHALKEEILGIIKQKQEQHIAIGADLYNFLFHILPTETRRSLKRFLGMKTLKKVKRLQDMDDKVLTLMCDYLKPMTYDENSFIFRRGDPLDCMLFIIEGTVWTYVPSDSQAEHGISSSTAIEHLGRGQFYGEELLDWVSFSFTDLPVSSKHVKNRLKVIAFVLKAEDLDTVVSKYQLQWKKSEKKDSQEVENVAAQEVENMAASIIGVAQRLRCRLRAITNVH